MGGLGPPATSMCAAHFSVAQLRFRWGMWSSSSVRLEERIFCPCCRVTIHLGKRQACQRAMQLRRTHSETCPPPFRTLAERDLKKLNQDDEIQDIALHGAVKPPSTGRVRLQGRRNRLYSASYRTHDADSFDICFSFWERQSRTICCPCSPRWRSSAWLQTLKGMICGSVREVKKQQVQSSPVCLARTRSSRVPV